MGLVTGHINATALQVRRAYESHHGIPIPADIPYSEIARGLILEMGIDQAKPFIEGQSNDPYAPEPPINDQA